MAGIAAIIWGFFLISFIAGVFAVGVGLLIAAQILDPPKKLARRKEQE